MWLKGKAGFKRQNGRSLSILVSIALVVLVAVGGVSAWFYLQPKPDKHVVATAPIITSMEKPKSPFAPLRKVDLMGMEVLVLRHKHTAQRVAVMSSAAVSPDQYKVFFNQPLSTWQLDLLMNMFKSNSTFEDKKVHVNQVRLVKTGVMKDKKSQLVYKQYSVDTQVNGQHTDYEAYLGMQVSEDKPELLVFTFNSSGHVYQEALQDFLSVSQRRS